MNTTPNFSSITEGHTSLDIMQTVRNKKKGPGRKQGTIFYNPAMAMNRDLSVLILQQLINSKNRCVRVADGMAATGIRGFRFINELTGNFSVTINDWDEDCVSLMKRNAKRFDMDGHHLSFENIHVLLSQNSYDYIDIDPFGSPAIYIDSAIRSIQNKGIIAVTATDTAALCGVYPSVCMRRYNARPLHGSCMHETALRVLIGFIGRQAGKYEKGIIPLLSYGTDHYFRMYLRMVKGVTLANQTIRSIHQITSDQIPFQVNNSSVGPLWMGHLHDKQFLACLIEILNEKTLQEEKQIRSLLGVCEQEALMPPFYVTTSDLSRKFKKSAPPLDDFILSLQDHGFFVTRTQFDPVGIKTNAPNEMIERLFLDLVS